MMLGSLASKVPSVDDINPASFNTYKVLVYFGRESHAGHWHCRNQVVCGTLPQGTHR